jgi:hypothetical protein
MAKVDEQAEVDFKQQVRAWLELDIQVKRLQQGVRERRKMQDSLTQKILQFMESNNIEDLNTKNGLIRYKVRSSSKKLAPTKIKEQLYDHFKNDTTSLGVLDSLFNFKIVKQEPVLSRLSY